jgi:hypothetical protein
MAFRLQRLRCLRRGPGWPRIGFGFEKRGTAAIALAELLIEETVFCHVVYSNHDTAGRWFLALINRRRVRRRRRN